MHWRSSLREDGCWRLGTHPRGETVAQDCRLVLTEQMMHNIPQPAFEHFIAKELEHDPNVEIQTNVAYVSSQQVSSLGSIRIRHRR